MVTVERLGVVIPLLDPRLVEDDGIVNFNSKAIIGPGKIGRVAYRHVQFADGVGCSWRCSNPGVDYPAIM